MKTFKKHISIFLFCFFSILSHASITEVNKGDLINKMSENENVGLLVTNSLKMLCLQYAITSEISEDDKAVVIKEKNNLLELSNELKKSIFTEFPEFENLDVDTRKEVFKDVMNTPIMFNRASRVMKCLGEGIGGLAVCAFGSLGSIQLWVFGSCISAALGADLLEIAGAILLGGGAGAIGVALAEIEFQVPAEAAGCWEIATTSRVKYTKSVVQNCVTAAFFFMGTECTKVK